MRVDMKSGVAAGLGSVRRRGAAAGPFAVPGGDGTARPSAPSAANALVGIDALLALQGEEDQGQRRRRSLKRGHDLLDGLDRLQAALLAGEAPGGILARLAAMLAEAGATSGEAGLDEVLAHVELRAKVELAKLARLTNR